MKVSGLKIEEGKKKTNPNNLLSQLPFASGTCSAVPCFVCFISCLFVSPFPRENCKGQTLPRSRVLQQELPQLLAGSGTRQFLRRGPIQAREEQQEQDMGMLSHGLRAAQQPKAQQPGAEH